MAECRAALLGLLYGVVDGERDGALINADGRSAARWLQRYGLPAGFTYSVLYVRISPKLMSSSSSFPEAPSVTILAPGTL